MFALLIPTLLSCLLLAAHFFRGGQIYLMLAVCAVPLLLVVRRAWAMRVVQAILILGALEWVRTTLEIRAVRLDEGRDWQRMAIILGGVACFTLLSAAAYLLPPLRRYYRRTHPDRLPCPR
jgi:hypothetical protein